MDAILKIYKRGNLSGKYAIFFRSDKAINLCIKKGIKPVNDGNDTAYIIAGENTPENIVKAENFLSENQLYYSTFINS